MRAIRGCRTIVTGASSGIGRALVWELARHGARLLITARREERLVEVARQAQAAGTSVDWLAGDIAEDATRQAVVARALAAWDGLDLLVNNAGLGAVGPFEHSTAENLRRIMEVNFFAAAELIRASLPLLRRGHDPLIANVGSILGHRGVPGKSEYCASKFALQGFSEALRAELAAAGIGVLVVSPGTTQTEFFDSLLSGASADAAGTSRGTPAEVVARSVVRAIRRGRHEIIPSHRGRLLVWLNRLSPRLVDALVRRFG